MDMNQQQVTAVLEARKAVLKETREKWDQATTLPSGTETALVRTVLGQLSRRMDEAGKQALGALKEESS